MQWSTEQRFSFIETLLYWEGQINRRDMETFFNVSSPVATAEFKHYMEAAPGNMAYDRSEKVYKASPDFKAKYISIDPYDYFNLLRMSENDRVRNRNFFRFYPPFKVVGYPERTVDPEMLKRVVRVMREGKALEMHYQSMTTPRPHWRWITPHSLAFDGFRWHIRAFCHMRKDFRDFVFGRIIAIGEDRPHTIDPRRDLEWHTDITYKISPHPELSGDQKKMIEYEYGMVEGVKSFQVAAAFHYYINNRLRLDIEEKKSICLINREEVEAELARIKAEAKALHSQLQQP